MITHGCSVDDGANTNAYRVLDGSIDWGIMRFWCVARERDERRIRLDGVLYMDDARIQGSIDTEKERGSLPAAGRAARSVGKRSGRACGTG